MQLDFIDGIKLINQAYEKQADSWLMKRWIAHYQHTMSFDEFKQKVTTTTYMTNDMRSQDEILIDVKDILESYNGRG